MPKGSSVDEFTQQVVRGDFMGAIERWYAEDAIASENQAEPRRGRDALLEAERRTLARSSSATAELLAPPLIQGNHVALRWRFEFGRPDGTRIVMEEVAWQVWDGERIREETFYYDPAQLKPKSISGSKTY